MAVSTTKTLRSALAALPLADGVPHPKHVGGCGGLVEMTAATFDLGTSPLIIPSGCTLRGILGRTRITYTGSGFAIRRDTKAGHKNHFASTLDSFALLSEADGISEADGLDACQNFTSRNLLLDCKGTVFGHNRSRADGGPLNYFGRITNCDVRGFGQVINSNTWDLTIDGLYYYGDSNSRTPMGTPAVNLAGSGRVVDSRWEHHTRTRHPVCARISGTWDINSVWIENVNDIELVDAFVTAPDTRRLYRQKACVARLTNSRLDVSGSLSVHDSTPVAQVYQCDAASVVREGGVVKVGAQN